MYKCKTYKEFKEMVSKNVNEATEIESEFYSTDETLTLSFGNICKVIINMKASK